MIFFHIETKLVKGCAIIGSDNESSIIRAITEKKNEEC